MDVVSSDLAAGNWKGMGWRRFPAIHTQMTAKSSREENTFKV